MLEPRALLLRECLTIFGDRPFTVGELLERAGLRPSLATVIRAAIPALATDPRPLVVRNWLHASCGEPIIVNISLPPARQGRPLTASERVIRHRKRRRAPALPHDVYCFAYCGLGEEGQIVWRVEPDLRAAEERERVTA